MLITKVAIDINLNVLFQYILCFMLILSGTTTWLLGTAFQYILCFMLILEEIRVEERGYHISIHLMFYVNSWRN